MNKARRSKLRSAMDLLERAAQIIDGALSDESDSLYNLPESIQESDRGSKMEDAISSLECASDDVQSIIDKVREAMA